MSIQLPKIKVNVKNNEKNKESIFLPLFERRTVLPSLNTQINSGSLVIVDLEDKDITPSLKIYKKPK